VSAKKTHKTDTEIWPYIGYVPLNLTILFVGSLGFHFRNVTSVQQPLSKYLLTPHSNINLFKVMYIPTIEYFGKKNSFMKVYVKKKYFL